MPLIRAFSVLLVLTAAVPSYAQSLAVRWYTVADGLPSDNVGFAFEDSRGFMWFATAEGLSRYDGQRFRTYGTEHGLPNAVVYQVAEDRTGHLWVIAGSVLARMIESPVDAVPTVPHVSRARQFVHFRVGEAEGSRHVLRVLVAPDGSIWCATETGIYRSGDPDREPFVLAWRFARRQDWGVRGVADQAGNLWFAGNGELFRIRPGTTTVERVARPSSGAEIHALAPVDGRYLLVATVHGASRFDGENGRWEPLALDLPPGAWVSSILSNGADVSFATNAGVLEGPSGGAIRTLLPGRASSLTRDRHGNTWVTSDRGVAKMPRVRVRTWTTAHGLADGRVVRVVEDRSGQVYASTFDAGVFAIRGDRAHLVSGSNAPAFAYVGRRIFCDSRGDWWVMTGSGVFRLPGPGLRFRPSTPVVPVSPAAFAGTVGPGIYEHPDGSIWVNPPGGRLLRVARDAGGAPRDVAQLAGARFGFARFMADPSGSVWLSALDHLERLSGDTSADVPVQPGLPERSVRAFYLDSRGWLWLGLRYGGVSVTKAPASTPLGFRNYSTRDGLISNTVWAIEEDASGRMYFGTNRGIDRLDVTTGTVRHFSTTDGLAAAGVNHLMRDRAGDIWVATIDGLSVLSPEPPDRDAPSPPVYITAVRVAGEPASLPARGSVDVVLPRLGAAQNNLVVEFVGPDFEGHAGLSYQYRLDGADGSWSAPSTTNSVAFARLQPGNYRFQVRALTATGRSSDRAATVAFEIVPPVWRRWWFMLLGAGAIVALTWTAHRSKIRRLLQIEVVRRRVAQDLHDHMGSGLAQIAILSEVARRDAAPPAATALDETAGLARSLRDAMSDIVWMVDPHKDRLADLVGRMRQVAFNLLDADGLRVEFRAPQAAELSRVALTPERRRQLLLAFKEIVTNVARHAHATRVEISLQFAGRQLELRVHDDGTGFDAQSETDGNGLRSLRQRAIDLGGALTIASEPATGTTVTVTAPL